MRIERTDVLVVGCGGAGLRAAISAAEAGASVIVLSKLPADAPTCTTRTAGYITYSTDESAEELFRQIVEAGGFLNDQRLVETFVNRAPEELAFLQRLGVEMEPSEEGPISEPTMPGIVKLRRGGNSSCGQAMTDPLKREAERAGVVFRHEMFAVRLFNQDGRVTGALGLDRQTGELAAFSAGATVLATGGGSNIFERSNNPPGVTGDGIAMAYDAGAELVDIELINFVFPRPKFKLLFKVENPPDEAFLKLGAAHYFLGGVRIDPHGETTLPGLFAAGEATGGLFGAARNGGAAMADILIFGAIAGGRAAEFRRGRAPAEPSSEVVAEEEARLRAWRKGAAAPSELLRAVQRILWRYAGTMKTDKTLARAEEELARASNQLDDLRCESPDDFVTAYEARSALVLGQMIVKASAARRETRGNFWRIDYPEFDNKAGLKNIIIRKTEAGPILEEQAPVWTRLKTPTPPRVLPGCLGYLPR